MTNDRLVYIGTELWSNPLLGRDIFKKFNQNIAKSAGSNRCRILQKALSERGEHILW